MEKLSRKTISLFALVALTTTASFAAELVGNKPADSKVIESATKVAAKDQNLIDAISVRFAANDSQETPSFRRHVVPLLGKLGCNGRACHGSFQGRGGFRLSLFGYDFKLDHDSLLAGKVPRVNPAKPEASLILRKPTELIPHEGGLRYKLGSWEHHVLLKWIEGGAAGIKNSEPDLVRLEIRPAAIAFSKKGEQIALRAVAHWTDGSQEDVTPLCRFQSNDEQIAKIDASGRVTANEPGDSHVVVFYDRGVVPVSVTRPVSDKVGPRYPDVPAPTEIDRLVVKKLKKLGIVPSELCTDAEFLRRVSLDMTGTLPTPHEVTAFLADKTADKRRRKIDEMLDRPTYAAWWTTRLCDITGNNERALANITPVDQRASQEWYDWLLRRVRENVSYDKIVEAIVLSKSRRPDQSWTDYSKEMTDLYHKNPETRYADRPGLTHFWARRTITQPQQKALSFAYTFLGIRIQCAECHKHPFDQWTQQDYRDFTKFFTRMKFGIDPLDRPQYEEMVASLGVNAKKVADIRREYARLLTEGRTIPFEEVYIEPLRRRNAVRAQRPQPLKPKAIKPALAKTNPVKPVAAPTAAQANTKTNIVMPPARPAVVKPTVTPATTERKQPVAKAEDKKGAPARRAVVASRPKPKRQIARRQAPRPNVDLTHARLLGGATVDLTRYDDPRVPLMNWLRSKQNRYFARAFVNRVWAGYFNVGIVDPPDDLSLANPASNAELLDCLADGFVKHNYDMKWLHREIANSRTYQLSWRPNETNRLDQRNFSHAVLRRIPAEVAYDAVRQATSSDTAALRMQKDCSDRAIGIPGSARRGGRSGSLYALSVFGRSVRESNCDCDRSNEPSLLQTVFLRNDGEVLSMVNDPRFGWVAQIAAELRPKPANGPRSTKPKQAAAAGMARRPVVAPKPAREIAKSLANESKSSPQKATSPVAKDSAKTEPLRPEQKARLVTQLTERIKQLQSEGNTEQAKRVTARLDELKRRPTVASRVVAQRMRPQGAGAGRVSQQYPPIKLTTDKKAQLIRTAYLRTLSRYPDDREAERALGYWKDTDNVLGALRDLVWALVNTEEFIVNH